MSVNMFSIVVWLFVKPLHIERICMRYANGSDFSVTFNINSSYMRSKTRFFMSNIITVTVFKHFLFRSSSSDWNANITVYGYMSIGLSVKSNCRDMLRGVSN